MKTLLCLIPAALMVMLLTGCDPNPVSEPSNKLPAPENPERPMVEGADTGGGMAVVPDDETN